jgi:hypothetical protein
MFASAIRELAASNNPKWIAAALFQKTIQIWDVESRQKIGEFPAEFCTGARNLALAPSGGILVTGLSTEHGKIAAYEVPSGRKIWEQRLVYPRSLRFHPSGESILCTINNQSVLRLEVYTGNIVEVMDGTEEYIEEPSGDALRVPLQGASNPIRIVGKNSTFNIDRLSLAMLAARFSPQSVCLSEANGIVRCFSRVDGNLQWAFEPGAGSHLLRLHYSQKTNSFFGILWNFEKGGPRSLLRFDARSGVLERICEFDSWEEVFLDTADQMITSAGEIRELSNGMLVGRLAFPMKEYPDN